MQYLSLFSGAAGGDLGLQHLLGWECKGYVEWDKYCCRVLEQRIKDGLLSDAPVFCGDIREWIRHGYAGAYQGMVDAVAGGWPCQPHSNAGNRKGAGDEREMWPSVAECLRIVRPRWFLGENVPGILSTDAGRYFGGVLRDLAALGYAERWGVLSACAFGAPHTRERLFILAYAHGERRQVEQRETGATSIEWRGSRERNENYSENIRPVSSQVWLSASPDLLRVSDGVAYRGHQLRAAGNGQVPICTAMAFLLLAGGES